jgi:hypothetical protein
MGELSDHYRERAARRIDPRTALVFWLHMPTLDPYGDVNHLRDRLCAECAEALSYLSRTHFAMDPEEQYAVCLDDLPEETRIALETRTFAYGWPRNLRDSSD